MKEVTAKLKYFRQGPRKVRLVADMIRGRKAERAVEILSLTQKKAGRVLLKLLNSAIANAKHNDQLSKENLKISKITVDGGPVLKRWTPRAHGRATPIRERTSHVELTLAEVPPRAAKKVKVETK